MQNDEDDTYAGAMRRAQERTQAVIRDAVRALDKLIAEQESRITGNAARFEAAVARPYYEAGRPYGDGRAAALRWFREQQGKRPGEQS
jgi:hypothetical protein